MSSLLAKNIKSYNKVIKIQFLTIKNVPDVCNVACI